MRTYVDVAAVRIQRWLGRSRTLAGRRHASAALAEATSAEVIDKLIADLPDVHRNTEAGDVDGVVNLEVPGPEHAEPAARACLAHLRARLPAVELSAVWGQGDDYLTAYAKAIKPRLRTRQVITDLPAVADFPPLATCDLCRADAAVLVRPQRDNPERTERVCADCRMRDEHPGGRRAGPEKRLREHLGEGKFADTFADLARLPVTCNARTEELSGTGNTQLATVYADGNAIGDLMDKAAQYGTTDKAGLVHQIDQANLDAVCEAVLDFVDTDRSPFLPLTPHIMAGDDLLVSLPAAAGWPFVTRYLRLYTAKLTALGADLHLKVPPSVSAGIVISHATDPFAETVTHAEHLLRTAKRAVRGSAASIAWLDLTADGPHPPPNRPVLTLDTLTGVLDQPLRRLAALPASQRSTLAGLAIASDRDARLTEQIRRLDLTEVTPFLNPDPALGGLGLTDALRLVRWYA
ncbi:Cas10/Cmr2 second palm domain-containing protein [Mangrovihabitans endophyticus]|uniref:Cas10/Cmr2 second palm domain-containing protein n=1 Tax=Mangrovihabitans endophyticus TaxID=1751298 RepID=A0A8J3C1T4_9ACTN|nr:hypothetical protein [Mangrovihabitans endophyticus]GGL05096.1 hypothetical protein GCM10012284_44560 [Mangrovihabitans endophyticus]